MKKRVRRGASRRSRSKARSLRRFRQPKINHNEIGKAVGEALRPCIEDIHKRISALEDREKSPSTPNGKPLFYVGSDLRKTKNLGNYESFVFGFSLVGPVEGQEGDSIEKQETRDRLRPKYEATSAYLQGMMREVEKEIDQALG